MSVTADPVADVDVLVDVEVFGMCRHTADIKEIIVERPNSRQLRSPQQTEAADILVISTVSNRAALQVSE